jgi:hypothetical protein
VLTFVRTDNEGSIQSGRRFFDSMALDRLAVLTRHGRDFLTPQEYARAYRQTRGTYYDRLADGVLKRKGAAYWKYHREGLAEIGARVERGRLWAHVAAEVARMAANPGRSLKALVRSLRSHR